MTTSSQREGHPLHASIIAAVAYHLDLSVHLAAVGETDEASSETALALALLASQHDWSPSRNGWSDLPRRHALLPASGAADIQRRAKALAMEIEAHYVSESQHELASAYADAATWLRAAMSPDD